MWNLKAGRQFFHSSQNLPIENFWKTYFKAVGGEQVLQNPRFAEFLNRTPDDSNCPELSSLMKDLASASPIEWRATIRNIYAARTLAGDANAEAWSFRDNGVIELNWGYTSAAMIYATIFCHFYYSISSAFNNLDPEDVDQDIILMLLDEFERGAFEPILVAEDSRGSWLENRVIFTAHPILHDLPPGRSDDEYHTIVQAVEQWCLAHELAHHLLGHTEANFNGFLSAHRVVDSWRERAGLTEVFSRVNEEQRNELEADVLSFLLVARALENTLSHGRVYYALAGSMLGLTALGHISGNWASSNTSDTHPDFLTRYETSTLLVRSLTAEMPIGPQGDHPLAFLIQFQGFFSTVLAFWASRNNADMKEPSLFGVLEFILSEGEKIAEIYPDGGRALLS